MWFKGLRPLLEGYVVAMHEGACETGSQIPRPIGRGMPTVIRMRLIIRQSNLPACLTEVQLGENTLWIYATGLVELTDKMDEICISLEFSVQESREWTVFSIPVHTFTVFQSRIYADFSGVGIRSSQVVLKINLVKHWTHNCHIADSAVPTVAYTGSLIW